MNTFTATNRVLRRTSAMPQLTGLVLAALVLAAIPASAAGFVIREPAPVSRLADADANKGINCDFSKLSFQINTPPEVRASAGLESTGNSPVVENQWTAGATSEWHAGLNRAVDRLVNPPQNVNVYAVQTTDHLSGRFGGPQGQNDTLAGFAIVIH